MAKVRLYKRGAENKVGKESLAQILSGLVYYAKTFGEDLFHPGDGKPLEVSSRKGT